MARDRQGDLLTFFWFTMKINWFTLGFIFVCLFIPVDQGCAEGQICQFCKTGQIRLLNMRHFLSKWKEKRNKRLNWVTGVSGTKARTDERTSGSKRLSEEKGPIMNIEILSNFIKKIKSFKRSHKRYTHQSKMEQIYILYYCLLSFMYWTLISQ